MKRKKGNQKKSGRSLKFRLSALVLAFTMVCTSSGFTSLAEEAGEKNTEANAVMTETQEDEQAAAEQAAAEQAAAEQAAAEQAAAEQAAAEQAAAEQAAAEQAAAEQAAAEQAAAEQAAAEQAAAEQAAAEQAAAEQAAAEQAAAEQAAAEQAAAEQAAAEQTETEQANAEETEQSEAETEQETELEKEQTESITEESITEESSEPETVWIDTISEETDTDAEPAWIQYQADAEGILVSVDAPVGALPEGTLLQITILEKDSEEYADALELLSLDPDSNNFEAFNLTFTVEGVAVEPAAPVSVKIDMSHFLEEKEALDFSTLEAWHFVMAEDDTPSAVLAADAGERSEGSVDIENALVEFTTDSLQYFGLTWMEEATEPEETEERIYTAEDGGVTVSVTLPSNALPEDAELHVILQETEEEVSAQEMEIEVPEDVEEASSFTFGMGTEEETVSGELDLDIFFLSDGEEVEPSESAEVTIDASECLADQTEEIESIEVWHIEETAEGTEPALVAEVSGTEEAASGAASFTVDNFSEFEFHYTCSAGGWAGFGANLFDENGDTISAKVTGYNAALTNGRYTTTVDMPHTFLMEEFVEHFVTKGTYQFLYATVTDPNYEDEEHTFDKWPDEEAVGANELYGSEENPVVSVTIDGSAAADNPNYGSETVNSKTWHFTLTFADETSVTIPIYGNADGADDNGGKYCPKYLEINLYFTEGKEAVLNLGNGNGTYSDGDYTGSSGSSGEALRYGTGDLSAYADPDLGGNVTIHLPSDDDLDREFTVVDAIGTEGDDDYQPAVIIELGKEEAYDYKLIGWINIATGEYYDVSSGSVTAEIDLSDDNVFYADWIAASYDHGSSSDANLRDDTVSTADFVTVRMFDYNELFDLYSVSLEQDGTAGETWTDSGDLYSEPLLDKTDLSPIGNSFIFQNNGTTNSSKHVLSHANPMKWNLWTANSAWADTPEYNFVLDAEAYWNVTKPSSTILGMLYDTNEESLGVHYVGDADNLFWVDDDGYYTYDSAVSGAAYNQSDGRFYVYEDNANAFFPYNGHTDGITSSNGLTDYWFGMSMEVDFYLPSSTSSGTEENPVNQVGNEDMVFDFSGDDDIMIFIDDKMVVDMSGIHSTSYSRINFSTNTVTYSMILNEEGAPDTTGAKAKYSENDDLNLSSGTHTMKIFYMERGASASNLKVQFNVVPSWEYESGPVQTITAEKVWKNADGSVIEDTEEMPAVKIGLFDVVSAMTVENPNGVEGNTYTLDYTDDKSVRHEYVYTVDANGDTLTYTEYTEDGSAPVTYSYSDTNSDGKVLDNEGLVIAWFEDGKLHVRIDEQTLSNNNNWSYAWELLDADAEYETLELSESSLYKTETTRTDLDLYQYWSVIGKSEIQSHDPDSDTDSGYKIILTEAAQEASNSIGDTKEAYGWVIVGTKKDDVETVQVKFSQIAELETRIAGETAYGRTYHGIYGVTSQSEIDALGSGAIWYMEFVEDEEKIDLDGGKLEGFYLYCLLREEDGSEGAYYLALNEDRNSLTLTSDSEKAAVFYYDELGELLIGITDDEGENSSVRVEILAEGIISIDEPEGEAAKDDIRVYTLTDTESSGFAFTANNFRLPITLQKVDSVTNEPLEGVTFTLTNSENLYYGYYDEDKDETIWLTDYSFIQTDNNGELVLYLSDGIYTLTEVSGLEGYRDLPASVTITVENGEIKSAAWSSQEVSGEYNSYINVKDELTLTLGNMATVDISGIKTWEDHDNKYDTRPDNITIHLFADGEEIDSLTVTAEDDWQWGFTDLRKYNEDGKEIIYTVTEDEIPEYSADVTAVEDGFEIINKLPEPKITKEIAEDDYERKDQDIEHDDNNGHFEENVEGDSWGTWDDADNNQEVTYRLKLTEIKDTVNLTVHDYLEDGLDFELGTIEISLYDPDERPLIEEDDYTATPGSCSDKDCLMEGCTFEVKFEDDLFKNLSSEAYLMITYKAKTDTHAEDYGENYEDDILNHAYLSYGVSVLRRSGVVTTETDLFGFEVNKYAVIGGEEVSLANAKFVLTNKEGQFATFKSEEAAAPETEQTEVNTYLISGWAEDEAEADIMSTSKDGLILIEGLDDDTYYLTEKETPLGYEIKAEQPIELLIDEYGNVTVEGETGSKESVTDGHVINVENALELTEISGTKKWDDNENQDGIRPQYIIISLKAADGEPALDADGKEIPEKKVEPDENGNWTWTFDLPKYDVSNPDNVYEIVYTIEEEIVEGYDPVYDEDHLNVTNIHVPETISISGEKIWVDEDDQAGKRPESITINLLADGNPALDENGEPITAKVTSDDDWKFSFEGRPKYKEGNEIRYDITEDPVEGYNHDDIKFNKDKETGNYTVTVVNNYAPEKTSVSVIKVWDDEHDQDGIRPDSITVTLLMNGEDTKEMLVLDESNHWQGSFTGLDKYSGGKLIEYTVVETEIPDGYTAKVTGEAAVSYVITNTHTPEPETKTETPEPEPQPTKPSKYVDIDGDGEFNDNKKEVSVGDELTYKITYYNNHTYADTVTITDTLDDNLEYVQGSASDNGFYDEETKTVTWYIGAEAFENGEVTFRVKVLDEAAAAGEVLNKATVQIGSDTPQETNELENPVKETSESDSGSNPTGGTTTPTSKTTPTSGTNGTSSTASSVKTADETPVGPMAALMFAALALMLAAIAYRRRRAER